MSNFSEIDHRKTRCFQHRGVKTRGVLTTWFPDLSTLPAIFNIFYPLKYSIFFTEISHSWYQYFFKKKYWVPARNTQQVEGKKLICTHILTWFQRVACVSKVRIPALNASLSSNPSDPKNVHFYCILAWMPRKSANTSIVLSIFPHTLLQCSSIFCVHFHCAPVLFACISLGFLDREYLMFWEAFWIALGCFWGA